jgi:hypothetical protein
MLNRDEAERESNCGLAGYLFQLVLCHIAMGLIIDSVNFAAIFRWPDYAAEINDRASANNVVSWRCERGFGYRNFTNHICHAFTLLVTVDPLLIEQPQKEIQK